MTIFLILSVIFLVLFFFMAWIAFMASMGKFTWMIISPDTMRKISLCMYNRKACRRAVLMLVILMLIFMSFGAVKFINTTNTDILCDWLILLIAMSNKLIFKCFNLMKEHTILSYIVRYIAVVIVFCGFPLTSLTLIMLSIYNVFLPSLSVTSDILENKNIDNNTALTVYFS